MWYETNTDITNATLSIITRLQLFVLILQTIALILKATCIYNISRIILQYITVQIICIQNVFGSEILNDVQ